MNLARLRERGRAGFSNRPSRRDARSPPWLAFLDDLADEEMFWHDEQVDDRERLEVVVHQQEAGIVAGGQTVALGLEFAVQNLGAEFSSLALQLEFLAA